MLHHWYLCFMWWCLTFSTGTISCLEFYGTSHLLSGGQDGLICVWSTQKWECLKSIRAHKWVMWTHKMCYQSKVLGQVFIYIYIYKYFYSKVTVKISGLNKCSTFELSILIIIKIEQQISLLEWFLSDHVTLKTGVMMVKSITIENSSFKL